LNGLGDADCIAAFYIRTSCESWDWEKPLAAYYVWEKPFEVWRVRWKPSWLEFGSWEFERIYLELDVWESSHSRLDV